MGRLKEIREETGWTQKQVAEFAGVSPRLLQEYEQERKDIGKAQARTALAIADALGVDIREIIPEE